MIYEIVCNITNERYIGSTFQNAEMRLRSHLCPSNKAMSKEIIGRGNYTFKTLETLDNPSKEELLNLEKKYILELECINKYSPLRTIEEKKRHNILTATKFYEENKDYVLQKRKEWYHSNKQSIREIRNKKHLCPCGDYFTIGNKSRHLKSKKHINNI